MPKSKSGKKLTSIRITKKTIKKTAQDLENKKLTTKAKAPAGVVMKALEKKKVKKAVKKVAKKKLP